MTARQLAREIRDYPATISICVIWIALFATMTYTESAAGNPLMTRWRWLVIGFGGGDRFGDLTLDDVHHAQFWRLLTCTFVHYSVLHVALNVLAMYQLGTMIESWYGSALLVVIYGLTGGVGNLVSTLIREGIGSNASVHSAGGSVVIMGLVGMSAVAGWRSKRRMGRLLARQMGIVLLLTAILGVAMPNFIDNWGHAGGALVGGVIGLAHQWLAARQSKPSTWGAGLMTWLIIAGCGAAQVVDNRRPAPAHLESTLVVLTRVEGTLNTLGRLALGRGHLAVVQDMLLSNERFLNGLADDEIKKIRRLRAIARSRALSESEQVDLQKLTVSANSALLKWYEYVLTDPVRGEIAGLRPLIEVALSRPLSEPERKVFKVRLEQANRVILREYNLEHSQLQKLRRSRKS
jgi:membrane associated rhomboid family serine protease